MITRDGVARMSQGRARRRDRQVYLRSHPVLFALLAATRRRPAVRIGGTVIAHSRDAYLDGLTRVPLDRTAEGTTGAAAGRLAGGGLLFDQDGDDHRGTRRHLAESLGADGVQRLRPVWREVLDRRLAPLAGGRPVDLVDVAAELSGATAAALLGVGADPRELAAATRAAAAAGAREHLPGPPFPGRRRAARRAADHLNRLLSPADERANGNGLAAMVAVAAVNTTVAGLPRAAAWCADAGLWGWAGTDPDALAGEMLRVTAPTPLLPRVAAAAGTVAGCPVRAGDRLILITRHAVGAHRRDPSPTDPVEPRTAQLVFGAGPHACPGARLARLQLADALAALAPYRPVVRRARPDRHSALPGWRTLIVSANRGDS
ncbi:cytochrome P450 [Actinoplanes utahensis]|uniref:cytochrome P450 n=1 Tax=Actinoplanes utahensis TaxID=1869 RepID=UPI001EF32005|nr:cytochrome P450 [Actinoplanes utahensis]